MAPPHPLSAFLSVRPHEPVLVFASADDAYAFQTRYCRQGRIYPAPARQSWVYVPLPEGLLRVRTARKGDVAFDFESERAASEFNKSLAYTGRVYENPRGDRGWEKVVYVGKEKV